MSDDAMIDTSTPSDGESAPRTAPRVDGRRLRSERTRRLIVESYMALVRENAQMPTAAQVAERAGYSVRSIFERFPDLTALRVAVTDYAIAEARVDAALRDLDAPRATRIRSQVEQRAQTCERWLPLWRVLSTDTSQSPDLHQRITVIRQLIIMRMEIMFKPELSAVADSDRRKIALALEALTTFESWARMRELYGLSVEEASAVWVRAIDRLLPATPS
ncbi:TetR/AcrR family transcriptional regulator [Reyranella sp.]|uniref:TetR/AcrR family transcriptional regulator n=1 Tax=Reyranella sp. TaxID=1929291 RepID=UPI003D136EDC